MFRCHPTSVGPTIKKASNETKINPNHRIWLKLMLTALIPLMIGVFTIVSTLLQYKLSSQQRNQDKSDSLLFRQQSERHADSLQKETVLVTYLNDVSKLLMLENETKIFVHIRTKTLTSLRQIDSERRKNLLLFLYESELIYQKPEQQISSLLKLDGADFNGIHFEHTIENHCSFTRLYLHNVYLSNSTFIKCYIDRANFSRSVMYNVMFCESMLIRTSFKWALLDNASFYRTKLTTMNFCGASLAGSRFTGTTWSNAGVDFTNTNLTGAILSNEQLKNSTLFNCILPNGTWGPIQMRNLVINGDLDQNVSGNSRL
jgi:uncharacterized protein YjbI with pentapeptide repeats